MDAGTIVGLLILAAIPIALIVLARPIAGFQLMLMRAQADWLRRGNGRWINLILALVLLASGLAIMSLAVGAIEPDQRIALLLPGAFVTLVGLSMIVFRRAFARFQLWWIDRQIAYYERAGATLIRVIAGLMLVAMAGGFFTARMKLSPARNVSVDLRSGTTARA